MRVSLGLLVVACLSVLLNMSALAQSPPPEPILWLRADAGIVADGDLVKRWKDQSGNGHDVMAPDSLSRPELVTSSTDGTPELLFHGWNYLEGPSIFPTHRDYTIAVVAKINNPSALNNLVSGNTHALWLNTDLYPRVLHRLFTEQEVATVPLWPSAFSSIVALFSDSVEQAKLFINGVFADSSFVNQNGDSALYIGSFVRGYFLQGEIKEVILYDRELDSAEQVDLSDYLLTRYSIPHGIAPPKPDSTFAHIPKPLQMYPRGDEDSGTVLIDGNIYRSGFDSIRVDEFKNGYLLNSLSSPLAYSSGAAPFRFEPRIHSELSEYRFDVHLKSGDVDTMIAHRDSIACGDIFLVNGQSNASFGFDVDTFQNEYCRTFGWDNGQDLRDTIWWIADANKWSDANGVGAWGQQIQKDLLAQGIPSCCINGSKSGTAIISHQRDTSNKLRLQTVYGRQLYRTLKSGMLDAVKVMFWDQGELNYADGYFESFKTLYNSWKEDYPNLQKVYLTQNRPNYCGWGNLDMRDAQREIGDSLPGVETIASAALPNQDGCHYTDLGYMGFGDRLYLSLARDFYHSSDTSDLRSAETRQAYYSRKDRTQITIEFKPYNVELHATPDTTVDSIYARLQDYLYTDDPNARVSSLEFRSNKLVLNFDRAVHATNIGYLPDQFYTGTKSIYEGPWIVNARGISVLLWSKLPVRDQPLDVSEDSGSALCIYPNPATGTVFVDRGNDTGLIDVTVISSIGVIMMHRMLRTSEHALSLDLSSLPAGCYTLATSSGGNRSIQKLALWR